MSKLVTEIFVCDRCRSRDLIKEPWPYSVLIRRAGPDGGRVFDVCKFCLEEINSFSEGLLNGKKCIGHTVEGVK